jgi:hypothetical protein
VKISISFKQAVLVGTISALIPLITHVVKNNADVVYATDIKQQGGRGQEEREERRQRRRQERREARRLLNSQRSSNACAENSMGRARQNRDRNEEIRTNAENSGISEVEIEELAEDIESQEVMVGEILIEEQRGDVVIMESTVAQIVVQTPNGVVYCHTSDKHTDDLLTEGITYIGGPLDNQRRPSR